MACIMTRRSAFAALLCLILIVTSVAFGAARGQARVAGQIVLCIGGAAQVVAVDGSGQPVLRVHLCPDCALSGLAAVAVASPLPAGMPCTLSRLAYRARYTTATALWRPRASARGPPIVLV